MVLYADISAAGEGDTESHSFFLISNGGNMYATSKLTAILAAVLMVTVCSVALISSESEGMVPEASPVTDVSELQSAFQNGGSYYLANNIDLGTIGDEETEDGPVLILDVGKTLTLDLNGNLRPCLQLECSLGARDSHETILNLDLHLLRNLYRKLTDS